MCSVEFLREFVTERLTAAAEEIFGVFEKKIVEYEEEIDRQRKLLDVVWKPVVQLHRLELTQPHDCEEDQENNSSLVQEDPEPPQVKEEQEGEQLDLKQEADGLTLTPTYEESEHREPEPNQQLLFHSSPAAESRHQESSRHVEAGSARSAKPELKKSHHENTRPSNNADDSPISEKLCDTQTEPPQQHVYKEEVAQTDQWLWNHERNQEDLHCPQIKWEQEVEQLLLKQETHNFTLITVDEESDHSEPESDQRHLGINEDVSPVLHCDTQTGKNPLQCDCCGKVFKTKSVLNTHLRIHTGEKPYVCKLCGKGFSQSSTLKAHLKIHTGEKPHICMTCGKRFSRVSGLNAHLRTHTTEKQYLCNSCGRGFNERAKLNKHMMLHTGEKPYLCNTCGVAFNQRIKLNRHLIMHTDERLYYCDICGMRFEDAVTFSVHLKVHRQDKLFLCSTCGKRFNQHTHLKLHMKVHTH